MGFFDWLGRKVRCYGPAGLSQKPGYFRRVAHQLRIGFDAFFRPAAAGTFGGYRQPPWKSQAAGKERLTLASGAQWLRDSHGDWHLLAADHIETQMAVLELLDHLYGPIRIGVKDFKQKIMRRKRLAELFELGLRLPMNYLYRLAHEL